MFGNSVHTWFVWWKPWMEGRVQALLEAIDNSTPQRIRPCDLQKLINSLKLRKACGIDGIPGECLRHLPRRPLVHLTHLFNHCLRLFHFPNTWKEAKIIMLPKPVRIQNSLKIYIRLASCPQQANYSKKSFWKIVQKHTEERGLLNASHFVFHARHSTTLLCTEANGPRDT
jgi:hypothetical protein